MGGEGGGVVWSANVVIHPLYRENRPRLVFARDDRIDLLPTIDRLVGESRLLYPFAPNAPNARRLRFNALRRLPAITRPVLPRL